ncbi:MAG: hypothetical protein PUB23_00135 [Bacilli bacterium]|nr:hypothetical protein [Bacilli bacterium]MCI7622579.1 hypothetical protein [Bacilli bacterium]MDD6226158.1 hypothetical protein [Bacilli bacterium]MDD7375472.1 hypothetical protein [Bacilli bacterium]MDY5654862.1 hypothetical protein [Bacilli bacterium]
MKYKLINITKFSGIVLSLLTILLWFCPIALITYAPNETTRVEKLVAPFLEVTLISSVFLILVPLIIFLIINIVDLFVNKKYLSFVEVFISIYLFVIQIIFQSLFKFSVVGYILINFFSILLITSQIIHIGEFVHK